jgi:hypothetical protein
MYNGGKVSMKTINGILKTLLNSLSLAVREMTQ